MKLFWGFELAFINLKLTIETLGHWRWWNTKFNHGNGTGIRRVVFSDKAIASPTQPRKLQKCLLWIPSNFYSSVSTYKATLDKFLDVDKLSTTQPFDQQFVVLYVSRIGKVIFGLTLLYPWFCRLVNSFNGVIHLWRI